MFWSRSRPLNTIEGRDFFMSSASLNEKNMSIFSSFPGSKKRYVQGSRSDIKVPMREIQLSPTTGSFGNEENPPLTVYDTSGPYTDESALALSVLHKRPYRFKNQNGSPRYYSHISLTLAKTPLHFHLFTNHSRRRRTMENRTSASLHWPGHAMTGALLWLRPNSSPNKSFPSINFTNGALTRSFHGDRVINEQSNVFSTI